MTSSKQPRKQRVQQLFADEHIRRKRIASHLSAKFLEDPKKYYPRGTSVRKGDTVKIVRGEFSGRTAQVIGVDPDTTRITVEGVTKLKSDDTEIAVSIHPSNVILTKLDLTDVRRKQKLDSMGSRGSP